MKDLSNCKIPRLFEVMKSKGVTAAKLSRAINISQSNVTEWKMGRATPTAGVLITIAEYLDTTPDYLLGKTDKKEKPTAEDDGELSELLLELKGIITDMTENQKDALLDYAKYLKSKE